MPPVLLLVLSQAVSLPCTYRGNEVEVLNASDKPITFLVGTAGDPEVAEEQGQLKVYARFVCALDYVHDDFHARKQTLQPKKSFMQPLKEAAVTPRPCSYETLISRSK